MLTVILALLSSLGSMMIGSCEDNGMEDKIVDGHLSHRPKWTEPSIAITR